MPFVGLVWEWRGSGWKCISRNLASLGGIFENFGELVENFEKKLAEF